MPLIRLPMVISCPEVTKPLHNSGIHMNEVGQWDSDQVGEHIESYRVAI